jgi:hypothetical protein
MQLVDADKMVRYCGFWLINQILGGIGVISLKDPDAFR